MKINNKYNSPKFKKLLNLFIFLCLFHIISFGQEERKGIKNFAGTLVAFDFTYASHVAGFEYERILYGKKNISFGIRGNYILKYKSGNSVLNNFNISGGTSRGNYKISLRQLWGTAYFYTSGSKVNNGFFFTTAVGLTHSKIVRTVSAPFGPNNYEDILAGFEGGGGIKFSISQKNDLRLMTTLSYISGKKGSDPSPNKAGIVFLTGKISLGF
jgi:hypothetical protein